jgi:hypothetical protein
MAFLIGALIGGWFLGMIFIAIIDRFAFRERPPFQRATIEAVIAFAIIYTIAGFGFANGNGFAPVAGFLYIPGLAIAWFLHRRKLEKAWTEDGVDAFS